MVLPSNTMVLPSNTMVLPSNTYLVLSTERFALVLELQFVLSESLTAPDQHQQFLS